MQPGDQVEAQREALPAVAIALGEYAKDFQAANETLLLLVGQFRLARLLLRRPALFMELLQALIAAVAEQLKALMRLDLAPPVEGKVMHGAASMRRA